METKTYYLSQKYKSKFVFSGVFLFIGSVLGFVFTFSGAYTIVFTITVFLVSSAGIYMSIFNLLSIYKTVLNISESSIEFIFPLGYKKTEWESITKAELNSSSFRLYFRKKSKSNPLNLNSIFFYKDNEIPVYLFLDKWQDEKSWEEEPLLIFISKKVPIEKIG